MAGFAFPDPMATPRKTKPKRKTARAKTGRPTDYRPEMCRRVVELGREGKSRAQIAAALDVSRQTVATWEKTHRAFLDAMSRAHDLALAWWEEQGTRGIWAGKQFNAQAYGLQMRNRFAAEYSRPEATFELNLDEVRAALASKLDRLAAGSAAPVVAGKPDGR